MPNIGGDRLKTSVLAPDHHVSASALRAARAAFLYGDEVKLHASFVYYLAERGWYTGTDDGDPVFMSRRLLGRPTNDFPPDAKYLKMSKELGWGRRDDAAQKYALAALFAAVGSGLELMPEVTSIEAYGQLMRGSWNHEQFGVPVVDSESAEFLRNIYGWADVMSSRSQSEFAAALRRPAPDPFVSNSARAELAREGWLACELLGSLPAFPDADWDVLRDIRDRLEPARVRFRAAMIAAAKELEGTPYDELHAAIDSKRRGEIAEALRNIDDGLEELKVKPTLLRVASDRVAAGGVLASLAVIVAAGITGTVEVGALGATISAAPLLSSGAREAVFRRQTRRSAATQPMWLLHEVTRD